MKYAVMHILNLSCLYITDNFHAQCWNKELKCSNGLNSRICKSAAKYMYLRTPRSLEKDDGQPSIYTVHQRNRHEGATLKAGPKQPDHVFVKAATHKTQSPPKRQ